MEPSAFRSLLYQLSRSGASLHAPTATLSCGSSDKLARIFTREKDRMADAGTIAAFEESVQASAIPQQTVGAVNTQDLPGPEFLTQKSGTKEGQTQIVKDTDGAPTVYQWSMSQQTWIKIGQLVDSAEGESKKTFNGKEYDYVVRHQH